MTETVFTRFNAPPPRGTVIERFPLHLPEGGKRILKRMRHHFDESLADRRYWSSLLSRRRNAHVTGILTIDDTFLWSTSAPRPEAVMGDEYNAAMVRTLFEAGHSVDSREQDVYPWALVSSVTPAEAFRFGGFVNYIAPERELLLRLASVYGSSEITQFIGTLDEFVVRYGDQLRAANVPPEDNATLHYL